MSESQEIITIENGNNVPPVNTDSIDLDDLIQNLQQKFDENAQTVYTMATNMTGNISELAKKTTDELVQLKTQLAAKIAEIDHVIQSKGTQDNGQKYKSKPQDGGKSDPYYYKYMKYKTKYEKRLQELGLVDNQ